MIRQQRLEVPFIAVHRKELLFPGLEISGLWKVYYMDEKWCELQGKKMKMKSLLLSMQLFLRGSQMVGLTLGQDDLEAADTLEELTDVEKHFVLNYSKYFGPCQDFIKKRAKEKREGKKSRNGKVKKTKVKEIVTKTIKKVSVRTVRNDDGVEIVEEEVEEEGETDIETEEEKEITDDEATDEEGLNICFDSDVNMDLNFAHEKESFPKYSELSIFSMAIKFGLTSTQFGENLKDGYLKNEPVQEPVDVTEVACNYLNETYAKVEDVVKASIHMVATAIAREPLVRKSVRKSFQEMAMVHVMPTMKGLTEIDKGNNVYMQKCVQVQPLREFTYEQLLELEDASAAKLVEVTVAFSGQITYSSFLSKVQDLYRVAEGSKSVVNWNKVRSDAVEMAFKKMLFPQLMTEIIHRIREEALQVAICLKQVMSLVAKEETEQFKNKERGQIHYFSSLDPDLTGEISSSLTKSGNEAVPVQDGYISQLLNSISKEGSICPVAKFICNDGQITQIPYQILCMVWPGFYNIVKESSCCGSDICITVPASSITLGHVKEIIFHGQSSNLDYDTQFAVTNFFTSVGWHLNIQRVMSGEVYDEEVHETLIIEESCVDDSSDEEDEIKQFWKREAVAQSKVTSRHCSLVCRNNCQTISQTWSSEDLLSVESMFSGERLLTRKNKLISHLVAQGNIGTTTDGYVVKSQVFCLKYMSFLTGLSEYLLRKVMEDYWRGIRFYEHGNRGIVKQPSIATVRFVSWFKQFLSLYGQAAPDEQLTILPYWLKGKVLYKMYTEEVSQPRIALPTFYKYLKTFFGPQRIDQSFPCVRISRYSSHSVCSICVALNSNKKLCQTESELNMVKGLTNQHRADIGGARKAVDGIKQSAIHFPQDNLMIQVRF